MHVWSAFWELSTCRPSSGGFGMLPIPWTAIRRWADEHEVGNPERFARLIRAMDREAMNAQRKKAEKDSKAQDEKRRANEARVKAGKERRRG